MHSNTYCKRSFPGKNSAGAERRGSGELAGGYRWNGALEDWLFAVNGKPDRKTIKVFLYCLFNGKLSRTLRSGRDGNNGYDPSRRFE
nr:hypothetical protein Iba_chr08cCG1060 [Ipomoea batatas]